MVDTARNETDLTGRTVLVTGANSRMGVVIVREALCAGATTAMLCRNEERGETARESILDDLARDGVSPSERPELHIADLTDPASIASFTDNFQGVHDRLDVLVNVAGGMFTQRQIAADGLELTFALNLMAPVRLIRELRPLLDRSSSARVVNFASEAHRYARLNVENLPVALPYRPFGAYAHNKLALILWSRYAAPDLADSKITINSLHPGFVRSDFSGVTGFSGSLFRFAGNRLARSPEKGAETAIHLLADPLVEKHTGEYWANGKIVEPSRAARSDKFAEDVGKLVGSLP